MENGRIKDYSKAKLTWTNCTSLDIIQKYTSPWNSDRHPGSTISASPQAINLLSLESFGTFSGANTTKFVVRKGLVVLLTMGIITTPGGYS